MMQRIAWRALWRTYGGIVASLSFFWMPFRAQAQAVECPRVVSQIPSITQTIDWLNASHCMVGVSQYDMRSDLPRTGGMGKPDYAAIAALRPDIVYLLRTSAVEPAPPTGAGNVRFIRRPAIRSIDDIVETTHDVAQQLNLPNPSIERDRLRAIFDWKFARIAAGNPFHGNVAVLTGCFQGGKVLGGRHWSADALRRAGFSVDPAQEVLILKGSEKEVVDQMRGYWDKHQITGVILLRDWVDATCGHSAQPRGMRMFPVGGRTMTYPSPSLIKDIDSVMSVVSSKRPGSGKGRR